MFACASRRFRREEGQGLVELIVALTVLAVGIGSLLTILTSSALSLQRSGQKGTALALAEKQLELYRNLNYADIRLDAHSLSLISASDPYMTAHASDSNIPDGTPSGQLTDTTVGANACDDTNPPPECMPIQYIDAASSPDHREYRIDTYIHTDNPNGGDTVAVVYVVVRNTQVAGYPILARAASTFSAVNVANVNGKSIVTMAFTGQQADTAGTAVDPNAITATLSGGSSETGTISFFVMEPPSTPSPPCTGALWQLIGTALVSGDGPYHPSGSYTPSTNGTYYWYASYSGDSMNKKASSICGASMAHMTVQSTKWSPTLSLSTTAATGVINTQIAGSSLTGTLAGTSGYTTGDITFMVYGPSGSAPSTCQTAVTGLWQKVDAITPNGNGSYSPNASFTPTSTGTYWWYASFASDLTNNGANSLCNSASMAHTVVTNPPDTFSVALTTPGTKTAGTAFSVTVTAQKPVSQGGGTDLMYSGAKTLTWSGPSNSPKGNAWSCPTSVTFTTGVATVSCTLYDAQTTTLTATQGQVTGTSGSITVAAGATAGFNVQSPGTQTAGVAFGVTLTAIDAYGNASSYSDGDHTISWSGASSAPNGKAPDYSAATTVPFTSGVGTAGGILLYNAASTQLTAKEGASIQGTSPSFNVNGGTPSTMAFVNCSKPTSSNTTCGSQPISIGNNKSMTANIALRDTYGNGASATSAVTVKLTSSNTSKMTVTSSVNIPVGSTQSTQLTISSGSNPPTVTITAQCTSGQGYADVTLQVD